LGICLLRYPKNQAKLDQAQKKIGSAQKHQSRGGASEEESLYNVLVWGRCFLQYPGTARGGIRLESHSSSQISHLLTRWSHGETSAREELVPLVYQELRRVAHRCLANQYPAHTVQSADLVHEAYLRLVERTSVNYQSRIHFFASAARIMRGILVDHARKRRAAKRGGGAITLVLDEAVASSQENGIDLMALDDALTRLAALDARQGEIVEMRFFAGLSIEDTSRVLGISAATVKREWATARLWLHNALRRVLDP